MPAGAQWLRPSWSFEAELSEGPPADLPQISPGPPLLIILSGTSSAGKDTIRDQLIAWNLPVHFAVTATTRPPRPGEVDGRDYHFLSEDAFLHLEAENGLIEHAMVYGQHKGVPREEVMEPLAQGKDVLARVDVQGADTLRKIVPEALLIFIAPPTLEEAERRLEGRNTETDEERQTRLDTAAAEMEAAQRFDYVVINETGRVAEAARRVVDIIALEKKRRAKSGAVEEMTSDEPQ
jgi:guanylate kinase